MWSPEGPDTAASLRTPSSQLFPIRFHFCFSSLLPWVAPSDEKRDIPPALVLGVTGAMWAAEAELEALQAFGKYFFPVLNGHIS